MQATLFVLVALLVYAFANNCPNPSSFAGREMCDFAGGYCGECVSFYKQCSGDRRTTGQWVQGQRVRGASIAVGTGIATFPNGKYYGHTAIYMGQDSNGIQVWDQWKRHPVSQRTIRWNGNGISNNGDSFYVIAGGSNALGEEFATEELAEEANIANDGTAPTMATSSSSSITVVISVVGGILIVMLAVVVFVLAKKINS